MTISTILAPTDFSSCSESAVRYAAGLARHLSATLVVIHVTDPPFHYRSYGLTEATINQIHDDLRAAIDKQMNAVAQLCDGIKPQLEVRHGDVAAEVVKFAEADGVDMIVLGTHGHSGFKHLLLGSVAEKIVRAAKCPVVTVPGN